MIKFNLDEYPNIDLDEFCDYIEEGFSNLNSYFDRYCVEFSCDKDYDNNILSISGKIMDSNSTNILVSKLKKGNVL